MSLLLSQLGPAPASLGRAQNAVVVRLPTRPRLLATFGLVVGLGPSQAPAPTATRTPVKPVVVAVRTQRQRVTPIVGTNGSDADILRIAELPTVVRLPKRPAQRLWPSVGLAGAATEQDVLRIAELPKVVAVASRRTALWPIVGKPVAPTAAPVPDQPKGGASEGRSRKIRDLLKERWVTIRMVPKYTTDAKPVATVRRPKDAFGQFPRDVRTDIPELPSVPRETVNTSVNTDAMWDALDVLEQRIAEAEARAVERQHREVRKWLATIQQLQQQDADERAAIAAALAEQQFLRRQRMLAVLLAVHETTDLL